MSYELYTWPHCEDCDKVKELLDSQGIGYTSMQVFENLEAKRRLRDAENAIGNGFKIKKDLRGKIIFPILVQRNDKGVERLVQGYDNINALFR
jgi:glutaredoxin